MKSGRLHAQHWGALAQIYVRSQPYGGSDKSNNGHRYDSIPIVNGISASGQLMIKPSGKLWLWEFLFCCVPVIRRVGTTTYQEWSHLEWAASLFTTPMKSMTSSSSSARTLISSSFAATQALSCPFHVETFSSIQLCGASNIHLLYVVRNHKEIKKPAWNHWFVEPHGHRWLATTLVRHCAFAGQIKADGGDQQKFDDGMRGIRKLGKQVWPSPDVMEKMGAKDALCKADLNAWNTVVRGDEGGLVLWRWKMMKDQELYSMNHCNWS